MYTIPWQFQNSSKPPRNLTEPPRFWKKTPKPYPYPKKTFPQNLPPQNAKENQTNSNRLSAKSKITLKLALYSPFLYTTYTLSSYLPIWLSKRLEGSLCIFALLNLLEDMFYVLKIKNPQCRNTRGNYHLNYYESMNPNYNALIHFYTLGTRHWNILFSDWQALDGFAYQKLSLRFAFYFFFSLDIFSYTNLILSFFFFGNSLWVINK